MPSTWTSQILLWKGYTGQHLLLKPGYPHLDFFSMWCNVPWARTSQVSKTLNFCYFSARVFISFLRNRQVAFLVGVFVWNWVWQCVNFLALALKSFWPRINMGDLWDEDKHFLEFCSSFGRGISKFVSHCHLPSSTQLCESSSLDHTVSWQSRCSGSSVQSIWRRFHSKGSQGKPSKLDEPA